MILEYTLLQPSFLSIIAGRYLALPPGPWTSVGLNFPDRRDSPDPWRKKVCNHKYPVTKVQNVPIETVKSTNTNISFFFFFQSG